MRLRTEWFLILTLVISCFGGCKKRESTSVESPEKVQMVLPEKIQLPEHVIGYVLAANPTDIMGKAEMLAGKAAPLPPGVLSMSLVAGLQQMGLKDTRVIDLQSPVGLLMLGRTQQHATVLACKTQGQEKLLESLKPVWKAKPEQNGIHELTREDVDTYGVFQGKQAGSSKQHTSMFIKFSNQNMFLSTDRQVLEKNQPILSKMLASSVPTKGLSGAVMFNRIREQYLAQVEAMPIILEQTLKQNSSLMTNVQGLEKFHWVIKWLGQKFLSAVRQIERISFAFSIDEDAGEVMLGFHPEKNSFFRKFLESQRDEKLTLANTLPADQFLAAGINVQWDLLKDDLVAFTREFLEDGLGLQVSDELIAAFSDMTKSLGDEFVVGESITTDGISLVEIFALKDLARYEKALEKAIPLIFGILDKLGMDFLKKGDKLSTLEEIGKHDGIKLKAIDINLNLSSMPAQQAQAMIKLYGEKMHMVYALFDGRMAVTVGKEAENSMKELIDRTRKKGQGLFESKPFQQASERWIKDPSGGFWFVSVSQVVEAGMQNILGDPGKQPQDSQTPATQSGLFLHAESNPDRLAMILRIPALHLEELGNMFKRITSASKGQAQ